MRPRVDSSCVLMAPEADLSNPLYEEGRNSTGQYFDREMQEASISSQHERYPDCYPNCASARFEAMTDELSPPVHPEEYWFRARLPVKLRTGWDRTRLLLHEHFPCRSEYLPAELSQNPFISPSDIIILLLCMFITPLYFVYIRVDNEELAASAAGTFLLHRVLLPGALLAVRCYRPWRGNRMGLFIGDLVVAAHIWAGLYTEVGVVIALANLPMMDTQLHEYEFEMFGCQPANKLWQVIDNRSFGEYMHWCYGIFYLETVVPVLLMWWRYPRARFHAMVAAQFLALAVCSVIWLVYPAEGPYWTLDPPTSGQVGYFASYIVHRLVEGGSSLGTACPSSHCATGAAIWFSFVLESGGHYNWVFMTFVPGLWISTIYGGFHYAIDSIIGVGIGTLAALLCHYMVPRWLDSYENKLRLSQMSPAESPANASSNNASCGLDGEL